MFIAPAETDFKCPVDVNGVLTLQDTEVDKNGFFRIMCRCSYCSQMQTQIFIRFCVNLSVDSVSVSGSVNAP